jgi:protease-4
MDNRPSIFSSSLRAFFITIFVMAGITVGLIIMILGIGSISSTAAETTPTYTFKVLPDDEGNTAVLSNTAPVILRVDIDGVIGVNNLTTQKMRTLLNESRQGVFKDNRVKAIFLNIDSPGGTVVDAQGIFQALKEYKERYKVPIYAYTPGLCASGGIYVAAISDKIFANDIAIVGSVGVIMSSFLNFSQLMEKIGLQQLTLSKGKDKDAMNPLRPWVEGEDEEFRNILNSSYAHFVNLIVTHRPISKEKLENEIGARVYPALQAKELGFVDEIENSPNQVLKQLVKASGLEGTSYQFMFAEQKTWLNELLSAKSSLLTGQVTHTLQFSPEYDPALSGKCLYLYRR